MSITIDITAFTDSIRDRVFEQLCANNPETRFETNAKIAIPEKIPELFPWYRSKNSYTIPIPMRTLPATNRVN